VAFLIGAIGVGILAIVFAAQGEYEAFGGGAVICIALMICWFVNKKKNKTSSNQLQSLTTQRQPDSSDIKAVGGVSSHQTAISVPKMDKHENYAEEAELPVQEPFKVENHKIAGVSYRQEEIESLGIENPIYEYSKQELIDEGYEDEKIYYYDFFPEKVELIAEPENEFDSNAVKVIVDGVHVGYIKKGSCSHVKKLLQSGTIVSIGAEIHGGKYKYLYCEYDEDKDMDVYTLDCDESNYFVTVSIKYQDK
jgi:hypothetical protein